MRSRGIFLCCVLFSGQPPSGSIKLRLKFGSLRKSVNYNLSVSNSTPYMFDIIGGLLLCNMNKILILLDFLSVYVLSF